MVRHPAALAGGPGSSCHLWNREPSRCHGRVTVEGSDQRPRQWTRAKQGSRVPSDIEGVVASGENSSGAELGFEGGLVVVAMAAMALTLRPVLSR